MNTIPKIYFSLCLLLYLTDASGQVNVSSFQNAYKANSIQNLKDIFNIWSNESSRASDSSYQSSNDTTKYIYDAFKNFYTSQVLDSIGVGWSLKIAGQNQQFLFLQENIKWGIVDSLNKNILYDNNFHLDEKWEIVSILPNPTYMLTDFYARLNYPKAKVITLTPARFSILKEFLGEYDLSGIKFSPQSDPKIVDSLINESRRKKDFLGKLLMTWNGKSNWYWSLYSYPYVNKITFSKDFRLLLVQYSLNESGGYAYFEKINNSWLFIKSRGTWIN